MWLLYIRTSIHEKITYTKRTAPVPTGGAVQFIIIIVLSLLIVCVILDCVNKMCIIMHTYIHMYMYDYIGLLPSTLAGGSWLHTFRPEAGTQKASADNYNIIIVNTNVHFALGICVCIHLVYIIHNIALCWANNKVTLSTQTDTPNRHIMYLFVLYIHTYIDNCVYKC